MDLGLIKDLGLTGFAMLLLWWMYQDSSRRLDARDGAMRQLEDDIRNKFSAQLQENTNAMIEYAKASVEHSKIMQEVMKLVANVRR